MITRAGRSLSTVSSVRPNIDAPVRRGGSGITMARARISLASSTIRRPACPGRTFSQCPVTRRPPRTRAESITEAAFDLSRSQGFYDRNPGAEISIKQITLNAPTENSRGIRLGSFVLIRDAIEDELEQAFSGKKSAKAALDSAVARGNRLLRQFEQANR